MLSENPLKPYEIAIGSISVEKWPSEIRSWVRALGCAFDCGASVKFPYRDVPLSLRKMEDNLMGTSAKFPGRNVEDTLVFGEVIYEANVAHFADGSGLTVTGPDGKDLYLTPDRIRFSAGTTHFLKCLGACAAEPNELVMRDSRHGLLGGCRAAYFLDGIFCSVGQPIQVGQTFHVSWPFLFSQKHCHEHWVLYPRSIWDLFESVVEQVLRGEKPGQTPLRKNGGIEKSAERKLEVS